MRSLVRLETIAVLIGAGILTLLLFAGPFVGVADNGDFLRVLMTAGLGYDPIGTDFSDRFFGYAHMHYEYNHFRGAYITSQMIPVMIARLVGVIVSTHLFDIRVLGFVYSLLLLAAVWFIIRAGKTQSAAANLVLSAAVLFVFFDMAYVAYFNSFFGEPTSFLFMLLCVAVGILLGKQKNPSRKLLVLFFICVLMLACSKLQNTPIGIVFAIYGLRFVSLRWEWDWRRLVLSCCASLFVLSSCLYIFAPQGLKHINIYQTVFYGILNGSPDVAGDLKALGLSETLAVNAGTNFFQTDAVIKQNAPEMKGLFYDHISHGSVIKFYAFHPGRLIEKMEKAATYSMSIRPYYLGNYDKAEGKPAGALDYTYSSYSELKKHYIPHYLWFIVLFYTLYFCVALLEYFRSHERSVRIRIELLMLVGFVGVFSYMVPIIGDGLADIAKHLFLFDVAFDIMLVTSLVWIVYRIAGIVRPRRRSYYY